VSSGHRIWRVAIFVFARIFIAATGITINNARRRNSRITVFKVQGGIITVNCGY